MERGQRHTNDVVVNDDLFAALKELVDEGAEKQEVDEGPVRTW